MKIITEYLNTFISIYNNNHKKEHIDGHFRFNMIPRDDFNEVLENNVFSIYDSQVCKPKFYDGHLEEDFDYVEGKTTPQTLQGYVEYLQTFDDELPDKFYNIKGGKAA